jgi:hypothetical protein
MRMRNADKVADAVSGTSVRRASFAHFKSFFPDIISIKKKNPGIEF